MSVGFNFARNQSVLAIKRNAIVLNPIFPADLTNRVKKCNKILLYGVLYFYFIPRERKTKASKRNGLIAIRKDAMSRAM